MSECSSPRIRGALGSFTATFLSFGIVVAYIIGALVEWQIFCFIIGSLPIVLGLAMVIMLLLNFEDELCIMILTLLLSVLYARDTIVAGLP